MRTDKQVHLLFAATPELVFTLAELPVPGPCVYESITQKEVEQRLDGLIRPIEPGQPEFVVEVQFYPDDWIYERLIGEVFRRRIDEKRRNVEGVVLFAGSELDLANHPARPLVTVVYLDEALRKLAARDPSHPAVAAFAPLWTVESPQVVKDCRMWYDIIRSSDLLNLAQRLRYENVFFSWMLQRLGLKNLKDLDMLITDLPELEDTDFYRLVREKGRIEGESKGEARGRSEGEAKGLRNVVLALGRNSWGPEPVGLASRLESCSTSQLMEWAATLPSMSGWEDLLAKMKEAASSC